MHAYRTPLAQLRLERIAGMLECGSSYSIERSGNGCTCAQTTHFDPDHLSARFSFTPSLDVSSTVHTAYPSPRRGPSSPPLQRNTKARNLPANPFISFDSFHPRSSATQSPALRRAVAARAEAAETAATEAPAFDPKSVPYLEPIKDINEIMTILPHRYPFLLVDRVVDFKVNSRSRGCGKSRKSQAIAAAVAVTVLQAVSRGAALPSRRTMLRRSHEAQPKHRTTLMCFSRLSFVVPRARRGHQAGHRQRQLLPRALPPAAHHAGRPADRGSRTGWVSMLPWSAIACTTIDTTRKGRHTSPTCIACGAGLATH